MSKKIPLSIFLLVLCSLFFFPSRALAQVVINEVLPVPAEGEDWLELYNTTDEEIVLRDLTLSDSTSNLVAINEATVSARGFLVFEVGNRLNNGGDTVYLKNSQGATVDEFGYDENPGTGIALGRVPDGGQWGVCSQPTKGSSNQCVLPTSIPTATPEPTATPTSPPPTAAPTPKPPTATSKPPTPTVKPTATSSSFPTDSAEGAILGESQSLGLTGTPAEESAKKESKPSKFLPVIFIFSGLAFIGGSFYLYWRARQVSDFPES